MRVPELPHMRELPAGLRDLTLQLPHLGELPNPHKHWVFSQLPHFPLSSRPVPGHSSRARRFRAAELAEGRWLTSPRLGLGETSKSFVHLFKGGGVWGETPRPYRGAGAKPPPSHTPKKGGRMSPSWGATEPGVLLVERAGWVPQSPLSGLPPVGRMRLVRCTLPPAAPVLRPWSSAPHHANF